MLLGFPTSIACIHGRNFRPMVYGGPHSIIDDRKAMIRFLRTENLTYMCILIHSILFNMVMPRLGSQDYVSDKDILCMYKLWWERR